jgi:hypothetical protein
MRHLRLFFSVILCCGLVVAFSIVGCGDDRYDECSDICCFMDERCLGTIMQTCTDASGELDWTTFSNSDCADEGKDCVMQAGYPHDIAVCE